MDAPNRLAFADCSNQSVVRDTMDGGAGDRGVRPGLEHTGPRCAGIVMRLDNQDADRSFSQCVRAQSQDVGGVGDGRRNGARVTRSRPRAIGGELHRSTDAGDATEPHLHRQRPWGGSKPFDRPRVASERDPILDGRDAIRKLDPGQRPGRDDRSDQAPAKGHALSMITFRVRPAFRLLRTAPGRPSASPGGYSVERAGDVL